MKKLLSIRVCPKCAKAFYTLSVETQERCTYCGFIYIERRDRGRISSKFDFIIKSNSHTIKASLQDYSTNGLRALYSGKLLPANAEINIHLEPLNIHRTVKAVWCRRITSSLNECGFKFI